MAPSASSPHSTSPPDGLTHDTRERHTGADFLAFLKRIARAYPKGEVHLILDSVSTHETPAVQTWLAKHKRFVFHVTPTSASWMNQIETWFGILTRQALRRGSFNGVRALVVAIDAFTSEWNDRAAPFAWVKTADEILAKATRKTKDHSGASHSSIFSTPADIFMFSRPASTSRDPAATCGRAITNEVLLPTRSPKREASIHS